MKAMTAGGRLICHGLLAALLSGSALADLRLPLLSPAAQVQHRRMALGDWTLRIETGQFSGDKVCRLADRRHHIVYAAGALGFRFARNVNTLGAWVRIDDGEASRWQDDLPELVRLGVPMDGASLDNPTDAIVWIPARLLEEANHIAIQSEAHKAPVTFHLRGFAGLRDIARQMGCAPEQRFVR